ncbi:DUF3616 domain-containing protein [Piscinibacter sp. HJYY11]|uniref:DUF3616 domain-containing protein n=1 Tax=Piscinibacter sp. HJYY11 TaxID=2801333 RepID=UPI00191DD1BC|nr:DUF3616 domain-containing protein [Piscinibacter sp. HJYY11]MBL0726149.1 DUF3616 domain-containing protein [Piscinibacter sp. HJYY11]
MEKTLIPHGVRLEFDADSLACINLSGAAFSGEWLWVVGDEAAAVELMQRQAPVSGEALHYVRARSFPLSALLELPGDADDEADLEGMAVCDGWLWLVGSHGLKRKNAKAARSDGANAKRLACVELDGNRRLLARVPIEWDASGMPRLVAEAADGRRAMRLKGDAKRNGLVDLLTEDPHLAPFLHIPGKDNGFDIEGLAVNGNRLLLGLRGPVLRGWTLLLEVAIEAGGKWLHLAPLDDEGTLLRKHFLQLGGLGVRDLTFDGDDLFLLAGPTMVLDGEVRLFRWKQARQTLDLNGQPMRFEHELAEEVELPHSPGHDRAEAFCELPEGLLSSGAGWLVLYDSPSARRRPDSGTVFGDLLRRGESLDASDDANNERSSRRPSSTRST